jgi:putative phage-type endonuclease
MVEAAACADSPNASPTAALLAQLPGRPRLVLVAPPGSLEWHETRRLGLGGSDVAAALGWDDYRSPWEVWAGKRGVIAPEAANEPMAWGHRLEPIIADWAAAQLAAELIPSPGVLAHRDHPWMLGNVDRFCRTEADGLALLECKLTARGDGYRDGGVPARVEVQVRYYQAITGLERAYVAVLIGGTRGELHVIDRDPALEQFIASRAETFWRQVQTGEAPPAGPSASVTKALNALPADPVATIDLPEDWREILSRRRTLAERVKESEAALAEVDNELRATMGEATAAYLDGAEVATFKAVTSRRLDGKRLEKDHPSLAQEYRTEQTSRRLLVKGTE